MKLTINKLHYITRTFVIYRIKFDTETCQQILTDKSIKGLTLWLFELFQVI